MGRFQNPLEIHGFEAMIDNGLKVGDLEVKDLLLFILAELKVINEHLTIVSDEELEVNDELEV